MEAKNVIVGCEIEDFATYGLFRDVLLTNWAADVNVSWCMSVFFIVYFHTWFEINFSFKSSSDDSLYSLNNSLVFCELRC